MHHIYYDIHAQHRWHLPEDDDYHQVDCACPRCANSPDFLHRSYEGSDYELVRVGKGHEHSEAQPCDFCGRGQ